MTSAFLPPFTGATADITPDTISTSINSFDPAPSFIDPRLPDSLLAMSLGRPGNVAPLPSPSSRSDPADHYFAPFSVPEDHSQRQSSLQQQVFLQSQRQKQSQHTQPYSEQQYHPDHDQQQQHRAQAGHFQLQPSAQIPLEHQHPSQGHLQPSHTSAMPMQGPNPSHLHPDYTYHQQLQQQQQQEQPSQFATHGTDQHQQRQMSQSSTDSEASLRLRDFSLVAEAAKRAQIAVVTRDLEDVSL